MKTSVQFSEISNELYDIFSDDRRAVAYMADSFGPQYIGLCGWAGPMSPANRAAFVEAFGQGVTDRAEAEARARVDEYRAAVAASVYHRHELEADTFAASYGTPEKSQLPAVGSFVWGRWSCLKGETGPLGELEDLEYMDETGREIRRRLCEVVAVVDADPSEFLNREIANGVARQFQKLGGSRWEESDPLRLDGEPMTWELVFCVRCARRWYLIDGQGYEYTRYFLMPEDFRQMYAPELATITAAREQREADERAEAQRQADARRADYLARCARWAPLMVDVRPLIEAERAAYGSREKSQIRKASAKLSAARRRNLVAMASAIFPGVKFSAKKWDGWGGSYELTWTDGPTEEHLQEAGDFDLLERSRDTFDGWDDSSDTVFAEFADFADKYFALGGQIRFSREVSDEFRQSIADRIRAAVPGLPEDERACISDNGQQSAICGMFREVDGVALSHLCDFLERGGLRDAAAYLARCMDGTPAHQDEPTDPTDGGGSPVPSYGDSEKSQHQEAPEGLTLADIPGGVAVVGDSRTTYRHRRDIKARGAKWNKAAQQWEATGPEAIANLREWLAAPESAPAPADDAPSTMVEETAAPAPELPAPPAAVVYDPAQPVEAAEFHAEDEQGRPYGDAEKSQDPEVQEYRLMYLFGAWITKERIYAETDEEAIHDADEVYKEAKSLHEWRYRVALMQGDRVVKEYPCGR